MTEFLYGPRLDKAIKKILGEPGCRAAVAFWGRESEKWLPQNGKGDFQVICNLMSGGTNPHAIEKLNRANVRRSDTLHAKVFLGRNEAVVASANVSANGLGLEDSEQAKWIEAGVLTTDTAAIASWMTRLWKESQPIKDEDIEVAKAAWAERQRAKPAKKPITNAAIDNDNFPLVYWHADNEDWDFNLESLKRQKITKADVENGLEAWGDGDLEVMTPGRWVLVWKRNKNGMVGKSPRPEWFQCGSPLRSTFRYKGRQNWYHTIRRREVTQPEPFDVSSSEFRDAFTSTIERPQFEILRTGDDDEPWLTPARVRMMREFWLVMQQVMREAPGNRKPSRAASSSAVDDMTGKVPDLSDEWDRTKLRNWMANARRLGRDDVYQAAFRQLCRVDGRGEDDPLAAEFAGVMRALEEAMTEQRGKTTRLGRTRQKLKRAGVRQTLADLALKSKPSDGFLKLLEFGMGDMAAEALIVKYRDEFEPDVVAAAERRLAEYGIG